MAYQKGQTGNPNGRPPKSRALTEILSKAGSTSVQVGDQKIAGRLFLARLLWQGVTTGTIQFPDGTKIELAANDWRAMVEFLYKHIDGPPPAALDITSGGEKLTIEIVRASDAGQSDSE